LEATPGSNLSAREFEIHGEIEVEGALQCDVPLPDLLTDPWIFPWVGLNPTG
jgi:hypothetical protein